MHFDERKTSFFDLEKRFLPSLDILEEIVESKVKFVEDVSNHLDILNNLQKENETTHSFDVYCNTRESVCDLKNFIDSLNLSNYEVEELKDHFFYKVTFKDPQSRQLCLFSSTKAFTFYGVSGIQPNNEIHKIKALLNQSEDMKFTTDVPINYDKILLGPLDTTVEELSETLNAIGLIVSIRATTQNNYFTFSFLDSDLGKSFVDVLMKHENQIDTLPRVRFCYQDCILVDIGKHLGLDYTTVIPCSLIPTKIVLLTDLKADKNINDLIKDYCGCNCDYKLLFYDPFDKFTAIPFKLGISKVFIECKSLQPAELIYNRLGGLKLENSRLITSFYPEYNFYVGEFE